jgi:glycosyltransferase involved in cell wall biosynthesis
VQVHTDFLSPAFAKHSFKNKIRVGIARRVLYAAAGIRVVTERIKKSLQVRYGTRIVEPTVIPIIAQPTAHTDATLPPHDFAFSLIAVSRFEREKCIGDILDALALVRRQYPSTGLFLVGEGSQKPYLEQRIRILGLTKAVIFLGWRTDAPSLMTQANAFIQASAYEGYGMTLIEAALARVPIITTDVGIVGDVLRPDTDVLVASHSSPQMLAAQIVRLIEDNQLRLTLAAEAEYVVRNHLAAHADQPHAVAEDIARSVGLQI